MSQQELLERSFRVYKVPNMVVAVIITLMNYPPSDMLWQGEEKVEERKLHWVRENVVLPNRIDNDRLRRLLAPAQPISPALISYPAHALAHFGGRVG
jgi:hypothetical protein